MATKHHLRYLRALRAAEAATDPTVALARRLAAQLTYLADDLEAGDIDAARRKRILNLVERATNAIRGHQLALATAAEELARAALQASGATPLDTRLAELHLERLRKLYPEIITSKRVTPAHFLAAAEACAAARSGKSWPALAALCKRIGYTKEPRDLAKEMKRARDRRRGGI